MWDFFWLCIALLNRKALGRDYFLNKVVPDDPVWGWLRRRFDLSERAMLALYRAFFLYGGCRIFAWFLWARLLNPLRGTQRLSWTWSGPDWVSHVAFPAPNWGDFFQNTAVGILGLTTATFIGWKVIGSRMWARAA